MRGRREVFGFAKELFYTPVVDEVFEAGLFAISPIAMLREDADHGCGCGDGLVGTQQDPTVCRELTMPSDAAEEDAEVDAGGNAPAFADFDGHEADVVRVGDNGDGASVVERDVELARQLVHVGRVGDVGLQRFGEGGDVNQFLGIDTAFVGEAVMLRMLSAPEPRELMPSD